MPPTQTLDQEYLKREYRNATNLNARIGLHQRFSLNPYGWMRWIFDQFDLPPACRILELGCGPGTLWMENMDRIPQGWDILLTDFSPGMLQQVQENLTGKRLFRYQVVDAQQTPLPFADGTFDALIANHMIYYIVDKPALFAEIRRVLIPDGRFYASTVGETHLAELVDLIIRFDQKLASWQQGLESFSLESAGEQITEFFPDVMLRRYEDGLTVTEVEPLLAYILSSKLDIEEERIPQLKKFLEDEMKRSGGVIRITKDSGIFISSKK
jgi:ubiquinone/menaquinone biosynthesis C-methylase UbiE